MNVYYFGREGSEDSWSLDEIPGHATIYNPRPVSADKIAVPVALILQWANIIIARDKDKMTAPEAKR